MPHSCTNCGRTFPDGSKDMLAGCPNCGGNKFQFLPPGAMGDEPPADPPPGRGEPTGDDGIIEAPDDRPPVAEDRAQASARSAVVPANELPPSEDEPAPIEDADPPDLAALREELNEQFESIKILRPGEYELNLMELYDRDEYIVALEEDGRYVIDVPASWRHDDPEPTNR